MQPPKFKSTQHQQKIEKSSNVNIAKTLAAPILSILTPMLIIQTANIGTTL